MNCSTLRTHGFLVASGTLSATWVRESKNLAGFRLLAPSFFGLHLRHEIDFVHATLINYQQFTQGTTDYIIRRMRPRDVGVVCMYRASLLKPLNIMLDWLPGTRSKDRAHGWLMSVF